MDEAVDGKGDKRKESSEISPRVQKCIGCVVKVACQFNCRALFWRKCIISFLMRRPPFQGFSSILLPIDLVLATSRTSRPGCMKRYSQAMATIGTASKAYKYASLEAIAPS